MLIRPSDSDWRLVLLYTGRVLGGVGVAMLVPAVVAFALGEVDEGYGFVIGAGLAVALGRAAEWGLATRAPLTASHGLAAVTLSWLTAPVVSAVPLALSGHYASFLDAYFEGLSGFATIGMTLVNDVDHLARSVNLWRHLMHFLGGQGIVVILLTAFSTGAARLGTLYAGEGREDIILPNIVRTARFIWRVALVYALIGTALLWTTLRIAGMGALDAVFHALNLFMSAFDTAGFSPQSTSIAFYRSPLVEAVLVVLMLAGALSFALHFQLWQGRRAELRRNTEVRTLFVSMGLVLTVMVVGLVRSDTFTDVWSTYRHAVFTTISGHTTTGLSTVPGRLLVTDWGVLAPAALVAAIAIGGMAGSTAGGIKIGRIAMVLKGLRADVRRVLLPESAVVVETYHANLRQILSPAQVRDAALFLVLWLGLYLIGALVGLFYGYPLDVSLLESTAAASSGGFSTGVVRPDLELPLKVLYMGQMLIGRLEFIAVFALVGYLLSAVRGRV